MKNVVSAELKIPTGQAMQIGLEAVQESTHRPMLGMVIYHALNSYRKSGGNLERMLTKTLGLLGYRVSLKLADMEKIEVPKKTPSKKPHRDAIVTH